MTEFKAPPIPPAPANGGQEVPASTPEMVQEPAPASPAPGITEQAPVAPAAEPSPAQSSSPNGDAFQDNMQKLQEKTSELHQQFNALPDNKKHIILYIVVFFVGLLLGGLMFHGGSSASEPITKELSGVVPNPDIKEKLKRCGMVSPSSPCVLYVMNSYDYEKMAEDFFETAVALTKRTDFLIRSDNVRYSKMRIPPGYFAVIKIPLKR